MTHAMKMLALCCGTALVLAGCDHEDRRTDAGEARSLVEEGQDAAQAPVSGDSGSQDSAPRPTGTPAPVSGSGLGQGMGNENAVLAMSGTPSSHLVDGAGSAVYALAGNEDGTKCDPACEEAWPPVLAHDAQPAAGAGVELAKIGTLQREGRTHVTYGGQPLYRYAGDAGAGRTAGAGVEDQWGKWSLVGLDGQPLHEGR